jgi:hypothetical protein
VTLSAARLLAVSSSHRGADASRGKHATSGIVSKVEHQLRPLIRNAQRQLAGTTEKGRAR